jgi:hypothetical protein
VDTTQNPPLYSGPRVIPSIGVFFGICFILLAFFGTNFANLLLPIQNVVLYQPTGDGNSLVIIPYSLSYSEMLKVPWYFLLPFSTIVYGCIFIGIISIVCGIIYTIIDETHNIKEYLRRRKLGRKMIGMYELTCFIAKSESQTPSEASMESSASKAYLSFGSYDWGAIRNYFFSGGSKSQVVSVL